MLDLVKLIEEDQKFISGVDSYVDWMKRTAPVQISLKDILNLSRNDRDNPNPQYPYNVQNIEELISTEIENMRTITRQLKDAKQNPVIKNDKLKTHVIDKMLKKSIKIMELYESMIRDIPYVTLDKS